MGDTVTAVNAIATIENLNMVGTFDTTSLVSATAIPIATIGLYQLLDQIKSDVSNIRSTISTNEITLQSDLIGLTSPFTPTDPIFVATLEGATLAFNSRANLTTGITNTKPSILSNSTNRLSEDAIFQFFSQINYEIMKFRYNITIGENNGAAAAAAGLAAIPIAIAASGV